MKPESYWYNHDIEDYEYKGAPTTDEEALKCLPHGAARSLYTLLREHKEFSIMDALLDVLTRLTGEK